MILNVIASDLAAVLPEYNHTFEIDSKVSLRILETYSIPEEIISADAMPYNNSYTAWEQDQVAISNCRNSRKVPLEC